MFAFVNGQPVDGFMGALPESQVLAFIERVTKGRIGGEEKDQLKAADAALAEGDAATRRRPLRARCWRRTAPTWRRSPGSRAAYVEDRRDRAGQADARAWCRRPSATIRPVAAARAALELAEQAKSVGPIAELEQKVAANPLDHQARFDLAVALNGKGRRQEAVDHLIEIVRRDRKWNDDGARKQLVQFFEAWGPTDEATVAGRKRLSSILFACKCVEASIASSALTRCGWSAAMPMNAAYHSPGDLPEVIPVFPLPGALLLPRGQMPLNIFEPRYLAMIDDALRSGHRLIGMIQPDAGASRPERQAQPLQGRLRRPHHPARRDRRRPLPDPAHRRRALPHRGGARRCRRPIGNAACSTRRSSTISPPARARTRSTATSVLRALSDFLKANNLKADWDGIENAPNEALVNALAMMSPYGAAEKQALLEAPDLKTRAEILVAVTEIELAKNSGGGETPLQ